MMIHSTFRDMPFVKLNLGFALIDEKFFDPVCIFFSCGIDVAVGQR